MRKILIGYDGSPESERAIDRTADLAIAFGAKVVVISVARPLTPASRGIGPVDPTDPLEEHDALVAQASSRLAVLGIPSEQVTALGPPARSIVEAAEEHAVDLIVVGSRDLTAIQRLLSGSVSASVAHHAPCDVLIVH